MVRSIRTYHHEHFVVSSLVFVIRKKVTLDSDFSSEHGILAASTELYRFG